MPNANNRGQRRPRETKGGGLPTAARSEQHNIFGAEPGDSRVGPVARTTDRATSHTAAKRAARGLTEKQLAVLDTFQRVGAIYVLTHETLIEAYHRRRADVPECSWYPTLTDSSVRTRCSELVELKYVYALDDQKGKTRAGSACTLWKLTERGKLADVAGLRFDRATPSSPTS